MDHHQKLFKQHIARLLDNTSHILQELSLPGLILSSGEPIFYFEDDHDVPFHPNHHFKHWLPLNSEGHLLIITPGDKPKLLAFQPEDFWHEVKSVTDEFWSSEFTIIPFHKTDDIWEYVSKNFVGFAYHGPQLEKAIDAGLKTKVESLLPQLNWFRSYKSDYEIMCLYEATQKAYLGHQAAKDAFHMGESELGIHHAYLVSARVSEKDLPYENIVGLDEKGAFLHYRDKRDSPRHGKVLLIDAGANCRGYASDITRTHVSKKASPDFRGLLLSMETLQQQLCQQVRAGFSMAELHWESHLGIAKILRDAAIVQQGSPEELVCEGITADFYPHGIGHMLGLLVHDVAGTQSDPLGTPAERDPRFPNLRTVRLLEVGHCVTVEPGLYFIKSLLAARKSKEFSDWYNWNLIDNLAEFGGIRIEDNVVVTETDPRNLTREVFSF